MQFCRLIAEIIWACTYWTENRYSEKKKPCHVFDPANLPYLQYTNDKMNAPVQRQGAVL